ncbi:MAG: VOC family protein [Gammaproteobacteria bacterium]|nr:VOC family protein [Gammaproteobacteria bacterium]
MNDFFQRYGILYLDHLALITEAFDELCRDYLSMPGSRLLRGPAENLNQRVRYLFVTLENGLVIEILAPLPDSPIHRAIQQRPGPYHFCYAVSSLSAALATAKAEGGHIISEPLADIAFDGREVAFILLPAHGIVEFVAAYPASQQPAEHPVAAAVTPPATVTQQATAATLESDLVNLFAEIFPQLNEAAIRQSAIDQTPEWDSLNHLRLIMKIESRFAVDFSINEIERAKSFNLIYQIIANRIYPKSLEMMEGGKVANPHEHRLTM